MFLEHDRLHVRQIDDHVDDREPDIGEFLGHLLDGGSLREADRQDRVDAATGEVAHCLFALGIVGDFEAAILDVEFLLELLGAVIDALVEGFVELAAEVVDDPRLEIGGGSRKRGSHHRRGG